MLLSHNWLKEYYTNPEAVPTPEQVAEIFTMHAFEIESIDKKGDDTVYDLKITPDRAPYAYGFRYVALELSLLVPELVLKPEVAMSSGEVEVDANLVTPEAGGFCPIYSLTKIENVQNAETPAEIKDMLASIGQQSRGLLVDLTNLVMFDTGQPLHVFDSDKVDGQIRVDVSKAGEKVTILGGKVIELATGTLVIRDDKDILAIAGVKGGVKAEVDSNTKSVYLESALFAGPKVRRTARSLNLLNDSSKRFEQQLTPERYLTGQNAYIHILRQFVPDAQVGALIVSGKNDVALRTIAVDTASAVISINKDDDSVTEKFTNFIKNILPKTGVTVTEEGNGFALTVPHYRADLLTQADVVDEFLRNVGYEFLQYVEPKKNPVQGLRDPKDKLIAVLRDFFVQRGFDEVQLHTLVDSKVDTGATVLANALTSERNSLRSTLKTGMLHALQNNLAHLDMVGKNQVKIFEIGNIFENKKPEVREITKLSFGISMAKWPKGIDPHESVKDIERELNTLLNSNVEIDPDRTQTISIVAEINLTILLDEIKDQSQLASLVKNITPYSTPEKITYKKASIYPSMSRDIAFFGSNDEAAVSEFIKAEISKHPLIENHFQFDKFAKDDKTSYGYRFVFQSYEKTLTEEEVGKIMGEIATQVAGQGWTVR